MRTRLTFGGLALVAIGLAACGGAVSETGGGDGWPAPVFDESSRPPTIQLVADPVTMPSLTMQDLDGRLITTEDLKGKVTIVNFWATWCGPCRAEIPDLIKLQDRYPDQLLVIGVSTDEGGVAIVEDFATEYGINYPVVMATPEIRRAFPGVRALPTSFVVDPDGRVVQTHVGLINPGIFEQETRFLTALDTMITVDLVEEDRLGRLVDAAHATEIPGLDLSGLTAKQRETALQRLNEDMCNCGCGLTLAQCRINDPSCGFSLPLAEELVESIVNAN